MKRSVFEINSQPLPLTRSIDLQFSKNHSELANVLDKQISAVIKRVNALFDERLEPNFDALDVKYKEGLHKLGDKLDWISENVHIISKWGLGTRAPLNFALKSIGHISFSNLKDNYFEVVRELVEVVLAFYLHCIPV